MNVQWSHIVVPVGAGIVAGLTTSAAMWTGLSQALLSVVAIIAAGVLVRLARGVPFSAIDVLKTEEARRLSMAIKQSVRALRALLIVCFVAILCLVFSNQIVSFVALPSVQGSLPFASTIDYSALLIGMLLAFIFMRTYAVVDGDIQIADIQADILVKKRGKDAAEDFQKNVAAPSKEGFRRPRGYGRVVEGDQA